jgi:hypothetical protein
MRQAHEGPSSGHPEVTIKKANNASPDFRMLSISRMIEELTQTVSHQGRILKGYRTKECFFLHPLRIRETSISVKV